MTAATRKRSFDPIIDADTRLLILGTLPGEKSLAVQQYYGNPQNSFWRLLSAVLQVDLVPLDYATRCRTLLRHGVGLWDVVAEAQRPGSLDSALREVTRNDLTSLLARHPVVHTLAFNGATARRLGVRVLAGADSTWTVLDLPSSSPAYTMPLADKLERRKVLRTALQIGHDPGRSGKAW